MFTKEINIRLLMTAEQCLSPHIIAAEILRARSMKIDLTIEDEGWDFVKTGVEGIVKDVCDVAEIPYENICFVSSNLNAKLNYFHHRYYGFNLDAAMMQWDEDFIPEIPKTHCYGLFLSRPTNERLMTFDQHLNRKISGLCTFHYDLLWADEITSDYRDFVVNYNKEWLNIKNKLPYSDLNNSYTREDLPLVTESHSSIEFWKETYQKISIEIVSETNVHNEGFFITEKILRPMLYGRPFVTIASKNFEKRLEDMGFFIFNEYINKNYDSLEYYDRVMQMFCSVEDFFEKPVEVYSKMQAQLEHNRKTAIKYIQEEKSKRNLTNG